MRKSWSRLRQQESLREESPQAPRCYKKRLTERTLPQNLDAERSVLGAVLLDPDALSLVSLIVKPDDFFTDTHRRIYSAMIELAERSAEIDVLTLREELDRKGAVEKVGGAAYLTSLLDGVPDVGNAEDYARIVKEKALSGTSCGLGHNSPGRGCRGSATRRRSSSAATGAHLRRRRPRDPGRLRPDPRDRADTLEIIEEARNRKGMLSGLATGYRSSTG